MTPESRIPKAKTEPGPVEPEAHVRELADALLSVSKEILIQSVNPQLPVMGQLILRRGKLMEELTSFPVDNLPEATRQWLQDTLQNCRKLDETIEKNLLALRSEYGNHLKGLKESHALLDRYRSGELDTGGSHSEDA